MAETHHHSGFDQEDFERYDTFDAPVSDQTNPDRGGLGGDIGRLIDEIKIANAANKLDQDVSLGEDRVLNDSGNWAAVPHKQLYESVHTNNDPAQAYTLAREWTDLGNMMADNSLAMDEAIRSTESGWSGVAAASARESTLKLATWGGDAAQTSQYMGTRIAEQGLAAERAKAAMPEPVEFDYDQMLRQGFASGGLAGFARAVQDVQVASEQARNAHDQAVQVMSVMERQSKSVDETTPRFVRPPDATTTDSAAMQGLIMPRGQEVPVTPGTPVEPFAATTPRSTGSQPDFGNGSAGGAYGSGSGYQAPAAASGGSYTGAQTYVPPNIPVPDVPTGGPYMGTSAQGYTPPPMPQIPNSPSYTGTPFPQGGYNPGDTIHNGNPYNPNSGYNPGNGQMPPGSPYSPRGGGQMPPGPGYNPGSYRPPNAPEGYRPPGMPPGINPVTGEPYAPGQGPRPGVPPFTGGSGGPAGGGGGGFGPRGGMPGGGGPAGFGETGGVRSGPPTGAAVGGLAAEEAAAMRGQGQNPALAGRQGAAGSPGMGGMGAGAKGGEDKEHRTKYATGEKIVEEPGRMVPLVIGEKTARQRKEEQPPQ